MFFVVVVDIFKCQHATSNLRTRLFDTFPHCSLLIVYHGCNCGIKEAQHIRRIGTLRGPPKMDSSGMTTAAARSLRRRPPPTISAQQDMTPSPRLSTAAAKADISTPAFLIKTYEVSTFR